MKLIGRLRVTGGNCLHFVTANEEEVFDRVRNEVGAPVDREIVAVAELETDDQDDPTLVITDYQASGPAPLIETPRKQHFVLMKLVSRAEDVTPERIRRTQEVAAQIEAMHRADGKGFEDAQWRGCVVHDEQLTWSLTSRRYRLPEIREQIERQLPGYEPNYWHAWGGAHPQGYSGLAYVNDEFGHTYGNGRIPFTPYHEGRHQLGCGHSTTQDGGEYADACSVAKSIGLVGPKQINLGLVMAEHAPWMNSSGCAYMVPVECWPEDVIDGEIQLARVRTPERVLVLSVRKAQTQNWRGVSGPSDVIAVHTFDPQTREEAIRSVGIGFIEPGEEREFDGVRIANRGAGARPGDSVCMTVWHPNEPRPVVTERPRRVGFNGASMNASLNGIWHDPRYQFQGLDLTIFDNPKGGQPDLMGYWFGHTAQGHQEPNPLDRIGNPGQVWYQMLGMRVDQHFRLSIKAVRQGELIDAGHGLLCLDDDGWLDFRYWTTDHGRDHFRLQMLARRQPDDLNGLWETGRMQGMTLGRYGPDHFVGYHYSNDDRGRPVWHMLDGSPSGFAVFQPHARHKAFAHLSATGVGEYPDPELIELAQANIGAGRLNLMGEDLRMAKVA